MSYGRLWWCTYFVLNYRILAEVRVRRLTSMLCSISGKALIEAGETFKQLADIKYSLEDSVRQNFLEPLQNLQTKDLKEVNVNFCL